MAYPKKNYGIRYSDGLWFVAGKANGPIDSATLFQDRKTADLSAQFDPDAEVVEVVTVRLTRQDYDQFLPLQAGDFPTHTPGAKAKTAQQEAPSTTEEQTTLSSSGQIGFTAAPRRKNPSHTSD